MAFSFLSRRLALAASVSLAAAGTATAQTMPNAVRVLTTPDSAKVYGYVEHMPELPGKASITASIREWVAPGSGCGSRVVVSFVVGPSGVVKDIRVIQGPGGSCNAAVLAAVRKLPRFKAGTQDGRNMAVIITVPLNY